MASTALQWPWPRVFAHRCGGALAPENTLVGLNVAARYGCGVEFDVMLSADDTLFVIHDETLERTTNGRGRVAETSDAVLAELDAGIGHDARFAGEPVPRLARILARCKELGLAMNIELKPSAGTDRETASALAAMLAGIALDRPPIVSSFSEAALAVFAQAAPATPRGLLVEAIPPDWEARCRRLGVVALHVECSKVSEPFAETVKRAGLWLATYTENDPLRAAEQLRWGVDCVITDRPDLINPVSLRLASIP